MIKQILRIIGSYLLAEVLTLFIDLTLSFSGTTLMRILCSICTLGILLGLMANSGYAAALADARAKRTPSLPRAMLYGLCGTAIPAVLWGMLTAARAGLLPGDFYRLYKLLCAPFLSICNLLSADVEASSLPPWGMIVLAALTLTPCIAVMTACLLTGKTKRNA
ncbi:MAG: hypothetical protein K5695_05190 [Oscillospiraceae bacterium]|nr:hypothetical protein [Oscillospiraceae bacterium]